MVKDMEINLAMKIRLTLDISLDLEPIESQDRNQG